MKIVIRRKNYSYFGFIKKMHYLKTPEKFFLSSTNDFNESVMFDCVEDAHKFLAEHRINSGLIEFFEFDGVRLKRISGEPLVYFI